MDNIQSSQEAAGRVWQDFANLTVLELLELRARQTPFRMALSAHSYRGYRDRLTYGQLASFARKVGAGLVELGAVKGDRIAVYLTNDASREALLTALGACAIGAVFVPLNTRSSDDELDHAFGLLQPRMVICLDASLERLQRLTSARCVVLDSTDSGWRWPEPLESDASLSDSITAAVRPDDLGCLLFTSGTTARSKAAMHTQRSMIGAGFAMGSAVGLGDKDLYQGAFPLFTSSCLNLGCMSAWVSGAGFVLENSPDNAERLRLIESEQSTVYHGVPAVVQFTLDEYERAPYGFRSIRRVVYGGAHMPAATIARIAKAWPWIDQIQVWAMTESGPAGAWLPPKWLPEKAGAIGFAMPNCEVRVVDENGQPVPAGQQGELCFRGPSMAKGYFNNPEQTAQAFRNGWLHTGDIVVEDQDGILRFVDRSKDIINRGGLKLSSAAVESALYRLPAILEAAVVPVPHDRLGEDVGACVVIRSGFVEDPERLQQEVAQWLADYEVPRHWFFISALPRNPMGKVLKRDLHTLVQQRRANQTQSH